MENNGFRRVMRMSESKAREVYNEKMSERESKIMKMKEKFAKSKGLALSERKLDEMFDKDAKKAEALLCMLENTERNAYNNPILLQNAQQIATMKTLNESRMTEAMQTGGAMGLMLPTDIVKVVRIGYTNNIAQDVFDVWGMTSMKDSIYKLETIIGSTERGATAGEVVYEKYGEGRYPSTFEREALTDGGSHTTYSATLSNVPLLPFKVMVLVNGEQVGADNGAGALDGATLSSGTINYTSGAVSVTFSSALSATDVVEVEYAYDFEATNLFNKTGSVLLSLVEYMFSAQLYPLAVEWTRFSEDLMNSKLGLGAKDMLIAGAGDEFRKAFDETCIRKGIMASSWTQAVTFDTDFASAGSDSSYEHAQSVLNAIISAEGKTYKALGRYADTSNIVCDFDTYSYLTKHRQFVASTPSSKVGIFKVGEIAGRGVFVAPPNVITNSGEAYIFGKAVQGQNVDAPVSVGSFGGAISTNPIELKNFNSQMGLGMYLDVKTNNKKFATKLVLENLSPNS